MEHLIDKSALVAEIEKRKAINEKSYIQAFLNSSDNRDLFGYKVQEDIDILSLIDTLEVKEVDLEKELDKEWNKCEPIDEGMGLEIASIEHEQFDNIAKHFFELGLKAQKGEEV